MASVRQKYLVAEQDLHAFVDGKLDGESYRTVIAYLSTSPEARERIIGFLRQQANLAALREQLSDIDPLPDEQMKALVQSLAGTLRYQRRARCGLVLVSGIALTLVIGLGGLRGPSCLAARRPWHVR